MTATGHDNLYFDLDIRTKTNADDNYENIGGEGEASVRTQNSFGNAAQEASKTIRVQNALQEEKLQVRRILFFIAAAVVVTFLIAVGALGLAVFMMMTRNVATASKPASLIQEINDCESNPCLNNGTCTDLVNGFNCSCPPEVTGDRCETDLDECSTNANFCDDNAVYNNTQGSYTCTCKAGYSGDGRTCTDLDECSTNSHNCNVNAVCNNTQGSYKCTCKPQYTGDGRTCRPASANVETAVSSRCRTSVNVIVVVSWKVA